MRRKELEKRGMKAEKRRGDEEQEGEREGGAEHGGIVVEEKKNPRKLHRTRTRKSTYHATDKRREAKDMSHHLSTALSSISSSHEAPSLSSFVPFFFGLIAPRPSFHYHPSLREFALSPA